MFFKNGSHVEGSLVTATSGGTLTLTATSATYQIFTGSSSHTLVLPNATTLSNGRRFEVLNSSSGDITVQNAGAVEIGTVEAGATRIFRLTDNSTSNGSFDITVAGSGEGLASGDEAQIEALQPKSFSPTSEKVYYNGETVAGNYWISKSPFLTARSYPGGFALDGFGYLIGGFTGSTVSINERYDDDNNFTLARANITNATLWPAAFVLGSYGYVAAGSGTVTPYITDNFRYDAVTNTWAARGLLNVGRYGTAGFSLLGRGYAVTGSHASLADTAVTEAYDDTGDFWYYRANVINTREYVSGGVVDDRGYVSPGFRYATSAENNVAESYNPINNTWTALSSTYPLSLQGMSSGNGGGRMNFFGGSNGSTTYSSAYSYNTANNTFTQLPSMADSRRLAGCFTLNGVTSVACGLNTSSGSSFQTTNYRYYAHAMSDASIYKASTSTPSELSLIVLLSGFVKKVPVQLRTDGDMWRNFESSSSALKTGESLSTKFKPRTDGVIAGGDNSGGNNVNTTSMYDESNDSWTARATMPMAKTTTTGFGIDGIGYIVGGRQVPGGTLYDTNYAFNSLINSYTTKAPTIIPRQGGRGTNYSGFGYNLGGLGSGGALSSVEKYNADLNSWTSPTSMGSVSVFGGFTATNGILMRFGGGTSSSAASGTQTVQHYSDITNAWTNKSSYPIVIMEQGFGVLENVAYGLSGANAGGGWTNACYVYNYGTDSWSSIASSNAVMATGCFSQNGGLYQCGGWLTGGSITAGVQRYHPASNTWTTKTSLPAAIEDSTTNMTSGSYRNYEIRVGIPAGYYGVGGAAWNIKLTSGVQPIKNSLEGTPVAFSGGTSFYKYSPELNNFTQSTTKTQSNSESVALQGQLYTGGSSYSANFEAYIPAISSWVSKASSNTGGNDQASGALNGRMIIAGGRNGGGFSLLQRVESYNPNTNAWTNKTGIGHDAYNPNSLSLNNFFYIIAGWSLYPTSQTTVKRYNDLSDSWTTMTAYPVAVAPGTNSNSVKDGVGYTLASNNGGGVLNDFYSYSDALNRWNTLSVVPAAGLSGMGQSNGSLYAGDPSYVCQYSFNVKNAVLSAALSVT